MVARCVLRYWRPDPPSNFERTVAPMTPFFLPRSSYVVFLGACGLTFLCAACSPDGGADESPSSASFPAGAGSSGAPGAPGAAGASITPRCTDGCVEGRKQCAAAGDGVSECVREPSGCTAWAPPAKCDADRVCSGGQCVATCTSLCTLGDKVCSANAIATCVSRPSGCTDWEVGARCADGETCSAGQCVAVCADTCRAGAMRCDGSGVSRCVVRGGCTEWSEVLACPADTTCSNGVCLGPCTNQCTSGASECVGAGVRTCTRQASGCTDWDEPLSCMRGSACSGDRCVEQCVDQCAEGAGKCSPSGAVTCELTPLGCTVWGVPLTCGEEQLCHNGDCVSADRLLWVNFPSPTEQDLRDVWGSAPDDVWAVGKYGTIVHWDGQRWQLAETGFVGDVVAIWGSSSTRVFAVTSDGKVLHFNGIAWSASTPFDGNPVLADIWGSGPNDVWVVGARAFPEGQSPNILANFNGSTWTEHSVLHAGGTSVWTSGADVWAVDLLGNMFHRAGGVWSHYPRLADRSTIAGSGPSDVWFGAAGTIAHFDGHELRAVIPPYLDGGRFYGSFARSASDAWMVGFRGRIAHFNGTDWYDDPRNLNVTIKDLRGVWASGRHDAWAVGDRGTIAHLGPYRHW